MDIFAINPKGHRLMGSHNGPTLKQLLERLDKLPKDRQLLVPTVKGEIKMGHIPGLENAVTDAEQRYGKDDSATVLFQEILDLIRREQTGK